MGFLLTQLIFWLIPLGFGAAAVYLGVRFVRAVEGRGGDRRELEALRERLAHLEDEVAQARDGIDRLEESQRFTERLLSDRPGRSPPPT
jgi:hypothetical protein